MGNYPKKEQLIPHVKNWRIAYAARELRQNNVVTLSCLRQEKDIILEELSLFSNSCLKVKKTITKPDSKEIFLEIVEAV